MSKWGKVDFRELKQLQKQLEQAQKNVDKMMMETAHVIAEEFLREVKARTPDSEKNKLQKHWKYQITRNRTGYNITVYNDLEYASYVEFGKRIPGNGWKQGYYMLTITEKDIEQKMNNLSEPVINKYLGEIFK